MFVLGKMTLEINAENTTVFTTVTDVHAMYTASVDLNIVWLNFVKQNPHKLHERGLMK